MQQPNPNENNNNSDNNNFTNNIIEEGYQENVNVNNNVNNNVIPSENVENDAKNNLIVNYLPPNMTEAQLKDLFNEFGDLESVKLMTDKMTKVSLGYGFVKFVRDEDAKKAMEAVNGKVIENKTLKVNLAKQNGKLKKSNIYIAYLSNQITDKFVLKNYFEKFGKIIDTKLLSDERGVNKGVGFVRFENKQDAVKAIQAMNGSMDPNICNGTHALVVKFSDIDKNNDKGKMGKNHFKQPFMKNYAMYQGYRYNPYGNAYGGAPNPYLNQVPYTNPYPYPQENYNNFQQPNMNFNYPQPNVNYNSPMPPPNMNNNNMNNNTPKNFAPVMPNNDGLFCLFVYNLPPESDDNLVFRMFSPYGSISTVKVIKEPNTGQCKGFAFVNFFKYEEAYAAITGLDGSRCGNKNLQVSFKKPNN